MLPSVRRFFGPQGSLFQILANKSYVQPRLSDIKLPRGKSSSLLFPQVLLQSRLLSTATTGVESLPWLPYPFGGVLVHIHSGSAVPVSKTKTDTDMLAHAVRKEQTTLFDSLCGIQERVFEERLVESLAKWTTSGRSSVWLRIDESRADLLPAALRHGFSFHHAHEGVCSFLFLV